MDIYWDIDLECGASGHVGTIRILEEQHSASGHDRCRGSPETLLITAITAITACYRATLANILRTASPRQSRVCVHTEGVIASDFGKARLDRVTVIPTIHGAGVSRQNAYQTEAVAARDECRIGRSIRGNVAYVVGEVSLPGAPG